MSDHDKRIKQILRAANHFDMLRLPRPTSDLLDQPVWDLGAAFAPRNSLCCHPDKSTHHAPRAFEALKKAKQCLSDELTRQDYLLEFVKQQKTSWEGNYAVIAPGNEEKQRVSSMRDEAQRAEADSVVDAMRERREKAEAAARKKQRIEAAQQRRRTVEAAEEDDDDDDEPQMASSRSTVGSTAAAAPPPPPPREDAGDDDDDRGGAGIAARRRDGRRMLQRASGRSLGWPFRCRKLLYRLKTTTFIRSAEERSAPVDSSLDYTRR